VAKWTVEDVCNFVREMAGSNGNEAEVRITGCD
jgi:hypothetical protein